MSNLKDELIKIGSENPSLQKHLRPVLSALDDTRGKNAYSRNQKESTMPTPDLPDGKWSPESDLSMEEAGELLMDALNGMARIEQKIHKEDLMRTVGRLKSWGETQGRPIQKVTEKIDKKHRKYIVAKNDFKRAFEELKKIM